jgi:iron(III) transport system ATP-binding protein
VTARLEVDEATVAFGARQVLRGVGFALEPGSIGCLLGPSGSGKTTLLRAIAGFEALTGGEIRLHGQPVSRPGWGLPPERRQVGMVFQDYALFPHLSVAGNIGFGLRGRRNGERTARVKELLGLVGLPDYGRLYPHQLSGGQQQRVALARALAPRPRLLLLDEPFASLDRELREQLAREVRTILRNQGTTALMVTHDQLEAFAMADQVGVLQEGRLVQWDSGYNLYHRPANRFVADFIGRGVLLRGRVVNGQEVETELGIIRGTVPASCQKGCIVDALVRPDDIVHDDGSSLRGEVTDKAFRGAEFLYTIRLQSGTQVLCLAPSHHDHAIGERIGIRLDIDHLVVFPRDS